jgi:hypothetical protein
MIRRWRSLLVLVAGGTAVACTSPEATRSRGGTGADVGNHPRGAVQLHGGAQIYYGTPTHGDGIGQRAFIGGGVETKER